MLSLVFLNYGLYYGVQRNSLNFSNLKMKFTFPILAQKDELLVRRQCTEHISAENITRCQAVLFGEIFVALLQVMDFF